MESQSYSNELELAVNNFLDYCANYRNLSNYTLRNYDSDLNHFVEYLKSESQVNINDLDRSSVRKYVNLLNDLDYKRSSINRKISVIRIFCRYLSTNKDFGTKNLVFTTKSKTDRRLPKILSVNHVRDLLNSVDISSFNGLRNKTIIDLMYTTGLRVSEISDINISDLVNLDQIKIIGKGSKSRVVYISKNSKVVLENYLIAREKQPKNSNALFINKYGGRLSVRSIQKIVKKCGLNAGLDITIHPHMVRHTFATQMISNGADLRTVQTLLGHSRIATTQIYTHVANKDMENSYFNSHPRAVSK
ncbi:MAG: recombinase XerC [Chloroflexi bacterium]|nr:recombinase XerC [Chloroflexota bacterium]|tara:strand:- start:10807 stop:11718 length:912 start_codon:yes stop_codon:yes gene_type:complete